MRGLKIWWGRNEEIFGWWGVEKTLLSILFHLSRYDDMEYPGEITDARHHEHQVNIMYPTGKDEYKWPEKQDEIYHLVKNIVCKTEPAAPTRNGLRDCFMIPK